MLSCKRENTYKEKYSGIHGKMQYWLAIQDSHLVQTQIIVNHWSSSDDWDWKFNAAGMWNHSESNFIQGNALELLIDVFRQVHMIICHECSSANTESIRVDIFTDEWMSKLLNKTGGVHFKVSGGWSLWSYVSNVNSSKSGCDGKNNEKNVRSRLFIFS